ncbi:hypothetical protein [Enterococcus casseliflavus]|uniref:hypothetical protein n=1 Tax=Enterococcus casseliflavus TaxID=37734 RepID=UPI0022E17508|nr:hypothetical protein [Enterococcus casseliflavus]
MSSIVLENYRKTIRDLSYDSTNDEYMTDSLVQAIDFDRVKDQFTSRIGYRDCKSPMSNDVFYTDSDGTHYFIEFKNGANILPHMLSQKNYDSTIILAILLSEKLEDLKDNLQYILVYNEEKITEESLINRYVQNSKERDSIGKFFSKKAKTTFIFFQQDFFKGYLFSEVFTLNKKEFQEMFVSKWNQID